MNTQSTLVPAQSIAGFIEFSPQAQLLFERMKEVIKRHYSLFGFAPLETAAVERKDVLLAKADDENRRQIYGLHLLERTDQEHGNADKNFALHFDLTVPFARYVAQHYGALTFPFRRYQIQKVWRGERPQKGRFREFYQADIDVIGDGNLHLLHDAEMPAVIHGIFTELNIGSFKIHLNNRKIHNGLLEHLGIPLHYTIQELQNPEPEWDGTPVDVRMNTLTLIDKMEKDGLEKTERAFRDQVGVSSEQFAALMQVLTRKDDTEGMLHWLQSQQHNAVFAEGIDELSQVISHMQSLGVPSSAYAIDLHITRGLDYYTGTVYETILQGHESIGSVCSGGRYDNLASTFIDRKLPGVGISIGLTRLFEALLTDEMEERCPQCPTRVIFLQMAKDLLPEYFKQATALRQQGIPAEPFLEDKKIGQQERYAIKKHIPYGVYLDHKRLSNGMCTLRNFESGIQQDIPLSDLAQHLHHH